jgi:hypothetical protein
MYSSLSAGTPAVRVALLQGVVNLAALDTPRRRGSADNLLCMPISDDELIVTLEHEADFRRQSGPQPKKVDVDFIADAEAAVADLKAQPGDPKARKAARKVTNRIQNNPLKGRKLD